MLASEVTQKHWQQSRWVQWLAVAIGVLPYTIASLFPTQGNQTIDLKGMLGSITIWSGIIITILLVLRFFCGERFRDLNQRAGTWRKDILGGIGISMFTTALLYYSSGKFSRLLPGPQDYVVRDLFNEVLQNPWLFALWLGPGILSAAGLGEELIRAFVLSRLWKISSNTVWKWITVLAYAVLFGLGHIYQGPRGVILAGIASLFLSAFYLLFGRVTMMIVGHYLHDVIQFIFLYIYANT